VAPPASSSLPARLVPPERVGFAFGFITALSNLGAVAGPALAGAVRDATPAWAPVWGMFAGIALAGAAVAAYVRPASGTVGHS
jgi:MFS family permease